MQKQFRTGNIGALMDEYERAAKDLKSVLSNISTDNFTKVFDPTTQDKDCRSAQTIMNHVVEAGYRYANQIRLFLGQVPIAVDVKIETPSDAARSIDKMLTFTSNSVEGKWKMSDEEIIATRRETRWGLYDIEMMFEHAIVHLLRHRRQIEKSLLPNN